MKKNYYFLLIPLLFLFSTESCDNYLEEESYTDASYDYLTTSAGVETAVNGVYYTMRWYANQENYMVLTEMGNDLAWDGSDGANKSAFNQYATLNSANSIVDQFWSNAYNGINRANTAMMFIPTATGMSDATRTQRMAECRFMRAYYYFDLVQHFGAVPLVTKGNISEIITSFKRDSVYDVYKQIISDLRAAYDVLPDVWQQTNRGRATKWAAGHLLAKVYLTRISADVATRGGKTTDLDSAAYYAVQVINSGKFALETNYTNVFLQSNEKVSKEVIWDVQFISGNDLYNERSTNGTNGGNQLHQYWVPEYQTKPGMIWDVENDSPFKRVRPNPMMIAKLWDGANDARLFKSFKWVYYSNNSATFPKWVANYYYLNPVTNVEDKSIIIYSPAASLVGTAKFKLADTAIYTSPQYYGALPYYSTFKTTQNVLDATKYTTMLTDIAKKSYLLVPLDRNDKKSFPTLSKHLDNQRKDVNDRAGVRNFVRMRLGETYLIAGEAYGRKNDWPNALLYINAIRQRGAYAAGEIKASFAYKVFGGVNNTSSTVANMVVAQADVHNPIFPSGAGFDTFVDWMLEERARELYGETNRWEDLVRTGTLYARTKLYNPDAAYIKPEHKLRPIPTSFIDRVLPKPDYSLQNTGY